MVGEDSMTEIGEWVQSRKLKVQRRREKLTTEVTEGPQRERRERDGERGRSIRVKEYKSVRVQDAEEDYG